MTGYPQIGFNYQYNTYQNWGYGYQYPAFKGVQNVPQPASVPQPNINLQTKPDTISFKATEHIQTNPKKEGVSTGTKWGLGALALAGIGTAVYFATRGKVGAKQAQQLAEHIEFKPAKTVEEAKKFAQEKLRLHLDDNLKDVELINFINEGITNFHKKTNFKHKNLGFVQYDKNLHEDSLEFARGLLKDNKIGFNINPSYIENIEKTITSSIDDFIKEGSLLNKNGRFELYGTAKKVNFSKDLEELITKYKTNPKNLSLKEKISLDFWINDLIEAINSGSTNFQKKSPFHVIYHEIGHDLHAIEGAKWLEEITTGRISAKTQSLCNEFKNKHIQIAGQVSEYACTNPAEFVAEVYAKCLNGQTFSDDVMALYKKYGGPALS